MKLLAYFIFALTAHAGVLVQWDDGNAVADPDIYFRVELNTASYLRSESPLAADLPPGRYVIRIYAVSARTGAESLPLEPEPVVLLVLEESPDLNTWTKARELIEPATGERKFLRLVLSP